MKRVIVVPGEILRVVDADTVDVKADIVDLRLDLGWDLELRLRLRLKLRLRLRTLTVGINCREHDDQGGQAATARLAALVPVGAAVTLHSFGREKFGRTLAAIVTGDGVDVAAQMVAEQLACEWNGEGPRPLAPWPRTLPAAA